MVTLNDSRLIIDLLQQRMLGKHYLLKKMQHLADLDAKKLYNDLVAAINDHRPKQIVILTHVPPFKEACMRQGKISDDDWLPYFSSKATGDVLLQVAKANSAIKFLVLCGHTHSEALYQSSNNLVIKAGKAEYFQPEVQEIIYV